MHGSGSRSKPPEATGPLALTRSLLSPAAAAEAFELLLAHAIRGVPVADAGSVALRDEEGTFRSVASQGGASNPWATTPGASPCSLGVGAAGARPYVLSDRGPRGERFEPAEAVRGPGSTGHPAATRAWLVVPVALEGEVIAALVLETAAGPETFDAAARETAEGCAAQLAWVLARRRWEAAMGAEVARLEAAHRSLRAETQRQASEFEVLERLRHAVARWTELDDVLELTGAAAADALGAPMVSVHLVEDGLLRLRHARGYPPLPATTAIGHGIVGRVAATGVPALVEDVASDPDYVAVDARVVSEVAVPLEADGEVLGVVNVESDARAFGVDDLRLLSGIRDQAAVAVARARLLAQVRASEARFRLLAEHARDLICLHAPGGTYTYVSPSSSAVMGYAPGELLGRSPYDFVEPADHPILDASIGARVRRGDRSGPVSYRVRAKDGRTVWLETNVQPVLGANGELTGMVTTSRDVTDRTTFEERLRRGALYDDLTGLPNRTLLLDRVAQAIERFRRHADARYAVLFLDLDRFKSVNDSLGHAVGDALLQAVAARLRDSVRASDTVARLGGDEFCVLLEDLESDDEAERTARRLQAAVAMPFHVAGRELFTSASIGINRANVAYVAPADVLRDADAAMYRAKHGGPGRHAVFDVSMRAEAVARLELESALRQALSVGGLDVAYLPVVRLSDGVVVGFEALARWTHPELGRVPPDVFVPLAEETGLIVAVDEFVARRACRAMAAWRRAGRDWTLSVNVSSLQFSAGDVVGTTEAVLKESGLVPSALRLEVTERVLMAHPDRTSEALGRLRERGTLFQVDDFGTGYSSLAHLQRLSTNALKLDRSFVASLDVRSHAVVAAVAEIARHLQVALVAEGIESEAQALWLTGLGYGFGQGFHFGPPLSEDEVLNWALSRPTTAG